MHLKADRCDVADITFNVVFLADTTAFIAPVTKIRRGCHYDIHTAVREFSEDIESITLEEYWSDLLLWAHVVEDQPPSFIRKCRVFVGFARPSRDKFEVPLVS